MDADIDLNGLELFGEDMDDAEIDLNDINMDGNQQDNHERTTTVPGNLEAITSQITSTLTGKRGRTQLNKTRESKDCQIQIDPKTLKPKGEHGARYSTWVGLEAKTRFSILGTDWRKFDQADKERMWTTVKLHWHLSDDTLKGATLKIACTTWKNFKKILKANYMEKNRSPCVEFNFIDDKMWKKFCEMKSKPEFQVFENRHLHCVNIQ
ncbi:hypothetical protein L6452_40819 [Arctium lappa]|uniref:Uncharacterized protein n=1 Tax=Arctium lappa TaxID=4217 RepID=A0ACB8XS34_ARCLA|nr:hypothetical protein L6452_40819 [Arctium lappa]